MALRRQGSSLVSGRSALVFWLLVLLLHVGFGSGLSPTGAETGASNELLLLLPFAAFTLSAATRRGTASDSSRRQAARDAVAGALRFPALRPLPRRLVGGHRAEPLFSPTTAARLSLSDALRASRPPGVPAV